MLRFPSQALSSVALNSMLVCLYRGLSGVARFGWILAPQISKGALSSAASVMNEDANVTNPNPREVPVDASRITCTDENIDTIKLNSQINYYFFNLDTIYIISFILNQW